MGMFQLFFLLEYKELRDEQRLNATQAGFQHASYAAEEKLDFSSVLGNLSLSAFQIRIWSPG